MTNEQAATLDECPQCASTALSQTLVKSAIWNDGNLAVIENIPAVSCTSCGEQFYDDATAIVLDMVKGNGFGEAITYITVPVFSFSNRISVEPGPLLWADE